jgi:hypothetical protein
LLAAGASLTIFVWRAGKPTNTGAFWFGAVELPILIWALLLVCRFAFLYGRVNQALATNRTADRVEAQCHERSSQPLAVLAYAWRFSSSEEENSVEDAVDGKTRLRPGSSQFRANTDVLARWLDIPGKSFYCGNAGTEYARHTEIYHWLLDQLIKDITPQLLQLPRRISMKVDLCADSVLETSIISARLLSLLKARLPSLRFEFNQPTEELSLFHADAWHDGARADEVRLLVAVQLRKAASEVLANGVAESASVLLIGTPAIARQMNREPILHIHRPAQGSIEKVTETLDLAVRWGKTTFSEVGAKWCTGLVKQTATAIRSSSRFGFQTRSVEVDETVGDAGVARAWLATTMAVANAVLTNEAQVVIAQESGNVVALVCRTQI